MLPRLQVKNSIIARNVTIEDGAIVENSILMQNTVVGKGAKLNHVISDKNVSIAPETVLCGAAGLPVVIGKGKKV